MPWPGWSSVPLRPDVRLEPAGDMPVLPDALEAMVVESWAAERARRPALFNGRVFCADAIAPDRITGHWTEYRRVLTQMRQPELFAQLRIRALAVNGLLECADGLVLGQRQRDAVYLPGAWQAAPAGNVEARPDGRLELGDQLLAELEEELGLQPAEIRSMRPVAAIEHATTHIVDVGFLLRTTLSFHEITERQARLGNDEYEALRVVAPDAVAAFLQASAPDVLPSARILLECWLRR